MKPSNSQWKRETHMDVGGKIITTCHDGKTDNICLYALKTLIPSQHEGKTTPSKLRKNITARKITLLRLLWHHGLLMLLVSGDIQVNPGPGTQNYKYPCGTCLKPVKSNQMGICCESCNIWYHLRCLPDSMAISRVEYDLLSNSDKDWHCFSCSTPYILVTHSLTESHRCQITTKMNQVQMHQTASFLIQTQPQTLTAN